MTYFNPAFAPTIALSVLARPIVGMSARRWWNGTASSYSMSLTSAAVPGPWRHGRPRAAMAITQKVTPLAERHIVGIRNGGAWKLLVHRPEIPGGVSVGHEALPDCKLDQVGSALEAKRPQNLSFVILDRAHRKVQLRGDFLHALALRDEPQYFELTRREGRRVVSRVRNRPQHVLGDERCEIGTAVHHGSDRFDQLLTGRLFQ